MPMLAEMPDSPSISGKRPRILSAIAFPLHHCFRLGTVFHKNHELIAAQPDEDILILRFPPQYIRRFLKQHIRKNAAGNVVDFLKVIHIQKHQAADLIPPSYAPAVPLQAQCLLPWYKARSGDPAVLAFLRAISISFSLVISSVMPTT